MNNRQNETGCCLLQNKTALITGCNRGIGKAILETFAQNGATVYAHARKQTEEFEEFCRLLSQENQVEILPVYFELTDINAMKQALKEITASKKEIDILVNSAGVIGTLKSFQMTSQEQMEQVFEVNFFAQLSLIQMVARMMARKRKGNIVIVSSTAGLDCDAGVFEYVTSKSAMIGATKRLAVELGPLGIRVNSCAPGLTDTDMAGFLDAEHTDEALHSIVMKRKAKPVEIANAILYLASDLSSYVTGQILRVDGGMLL